MADWLVVVLAPTFAATAAEPMSGPIAVDVELPRNVDVLSRPNEFERDERNDCVAGNSEIDAGYVVDTVEVAGDGPIDDGVSVVVPCIELSETPDVVGANPVESGERSAVEELEGSIISCRLLGAEGSSLFVSTGGGVKDVGTSELDWTALALVDCC